MVHIGFTLSSEEFLGLGTGENLNEHVVGEGWPAYSTRLDMLKEAVSLIRELWQGKQVNRSGQYFTVENARIYTLPEETLPLYIAAAGPEGATSGRDRRWTYQHRARKVADRGIQ